jgi:hypothetical protein
VGRSWQPQRPTVCIKTGPSEGCHTILVVFPVQRCADRISGGGLDPGVRRQHPASGGLTRRSDHDRALGAGHDPTGKKERGGGALQMTSVAASPQGPGAVTETRCCRGELCFAGSGCLLAAACRRMIIGVGTGGCGVSRGERPVGTRYRSPVVCLWAADFFTGCHGSALRADLLGVQRVAREADTAVGQFDGSEPDAAHGANGAIRVEVTAVGVGIAERLQIPAHWLAHPGRPPERGIHHASVVASWTSYRWP